MTGGGTPSLLSILACRKALSLPALGAKGIIGTVWWHLAAPTGMQEVVR